MAWVVDSCVLLDIALKDPVFSGPSASLAASKLGDGLVACPVSQVEISPHFGGQIDQVRYFLQQSGIQHSIDWTTADTDAASIAWSTYVAAKRQGLTLKRPMADIQIGSFATRFQGLITRNPADFRPWFPSLVIIEP